jgi:hypothetical protein
MHSVLSSNKYFDGTEVYYTWIPYCLTPCPWSENNQPQLTMQIGVARPVDHQIIYCRLASPYVWLFGSWSRLCLDLWVAIDADLPHRIDIVNSHVVASRQILISSIRHSYPEHLVSSLDLLARNCLRLLKLASSEQETAREGTPWLHQIH